MIPMDKKRIATLAGTLVLAGAVVAAGVYGPSALKVIRQTAVSTDSSVLQTPAVDSGTNAAANNAMPNNTAPQGTSPPSTAPPAADKQTTAAAAETPAASAAQSAPAAQATPDTVSTTPQSDNSNTGVSKSKYREPDTKLMDLAPSVAVFFGENGLSNDAKTLIFGAAWNIHQYVDGYLYGPAAGPQMNEQDIKKYILFHKTLLDKQLKNEPNAAKVTAFTGYLDLLLNTGIDAFDSKDKVRIEQFHQGIHDLDTHLMRNDTSSKIYGATPFATKRS